MDRGIAIGIIAQQVLASVWEHHADMFFDSPEYGLTQDDWEAVLDAVILGSPRWHILEEAVQALDGDIYA